VRTAEVLWQEGHTAPATPAEAEAAARQMLQVYRDFCYETLAMPVIPGTKTANERFAGADDTYTIEAMMQNGWALQAGTSHFLGQNFARAFDVTFQNKEGVREHVWASSWGVSTRLIGGTIMTHSDDIGLVLPPKVAPIQIIVVPIWRKAKEKEDVLAFSEDVLAQLRAAGIRARIDDRDGVKPGAKYFEWERKGVPLRMEIGPRDVKKGATFCARRTGGKKFGIPVDENFIATATAQLDSIQAELLQKAIERRDARTQRIDSYDALKAIVASAEGGFALVAWCDDAENEAAIKADCKATIRCYPIDGQEEVAGKDCFYSGRPATHMAIFARAY
jgi:prolyl-tRNA synthetase